MKKVWKKPKLLGIYRAMPHEAVLTVCKQPFVTDGDPQNTAIQCQENTPRGCQCCDSCDGS